LEDSDSDSSDGSDSDVAVVRKLKTRPQPSVRDASINMWDFGGPEEHESEIPFQV